MKALIQRVDRASVNVNGEMVGSIEKGLVVFIGVEVSDTEKDVVYLADKVTGLRIFTDDAGKFNNSCKDVNGSLLVVSQFTLLADTRHGKRPGFTRAATPELALRLFNMFVECVREAGMHVATGVFQSHMMVEIHNNGPVTILLDSKDKVL